MSSIVLLAQALPSASSGVDWLYQFTNNLDQPDDTEWRGSHAAWDDRISLHFFLHARKHGCELADLDDDVSSASSPDSSGRSDQVSAPAHHLLPPGDLLGQSVPRARASASTTFFSYIAQAMVAAFDQSSLDSLLQLLKTAGDQTQMPSFTAPVQILCYFLVQILLGLASAILFLINCSAFILYGVTALFGPIFVPLLMTKTFRAKFFHFLDVLISFAMIRAVAAAFIFRVGGVHERLHSADVQRQLFDGDVARKSYPLHHGFHRFHHQYALHSEHDAGYLWRGGWDGWKHHKVNTVGTAVLEELAIKAAGAA